MNIRLSSETLHASTVAVEGRAVLIAGISGSGKSDLALRLIDRGFTLVSDDQTIVQKRGTRLYATAPATIRGKLEVDEALISQLEAQSENILKGLPELIKQMQERDKLLKKDVKDDTEIRRRALRKIPAPASSMNVGAQRCVSQRVKKIAGVVCAIASKRSMPSSEVRGTIRSTSAGSRPR